MCTGHLVNTTLVHVLWNTTSPYKVLCFDVICIRGTNIRLSRRGTNIPLKSKTTQWDFLFTRAPGRLGFRHLASSNTSKLLYYLSSSKVETCKEFVFSGQISVLNPTLLPIGYLVVCTSNYQIAGSMHFKVLGIPQATCIWLTY